jgi:hypothetical protein
MSDAHLPTTSRRQTNRCRMALENSALLFASGDVVNFRAAMKCMVGDSAPAEAKHTIRWRDLAWDAEALSLQRDDGGTRVSRRLDAGLAGAGERLRRAVCKD